MNSENSSASRRGRPAEFSDAQLGNRRDQLVQAFEASWGEIGWELAHSEKADELITVFTPLEQSYVRQIVLAFCRPSAQASDWEALRNVRARLRVLAPQNYELAHARNRTYDEFRRANSAPPQGSSTERRNLKRAKKKQRKEFAKVEKKCRAFLVESRELQSEEQTLEASVAREELFQFLKSKRYKLTPLSLANAMANVPYSGWRQSMRRCSKQPCKIANGSTYQIFKAIRYLVGKADKRTERTLVADLRARIPLLPSRYNSAKSKLAEHWLFVERAIKQVFRTNPMLTAIPFKVLDRYVKQLQRQSQTDVVLAEQRKIDLSKR
jgi:hypothetical protein